MNTEIILNETPIFSFGGDHIIATVRCVVDCPLGEDAVKEGYSYDIIYLKKAPSWRLKSGQRFRWEYYPEGERDVKHIQIVNDMGKLEVTYGEGCMGFGGVIIGEASAV